MKILPTVGPISQGNLDLKKILKITDIVRINGSHNSIKWHESISKKIKKINSNSKILLDIPGVKPRTMNSSSIKIKKNQYVTFSFEKKKNKIKELIILCSNKIPKKITKTKILTLDDGKYIFKIIAIKKNQIRTKSTVSFELKPNKGINIPLSIYDDSFQSIQYKKFLKKTKKIRYDAIGLSYVQSGNIIKKIKKEFPNKLLISKIENSEGLINYKEIVNNSDAIMIDRGDLSAEIGDENLYFAILKIAEETKKNGKPLIIATENLISMNSRQKPTKSEIMSLGFAQQIDVDIIMLSDETAVLSNWKKILIWLNNYLIKTVKSSKLIIKKADKGNIFWNLVDKLPNLPIVIFSKKGFALNNITKFRENTKLIIFSDNDKTIAIGAFRKNTICYKVEKFRKKDFALFIKKTIKKYRKDIFKESELASLIYIAYPDKNSRANTISILTKKEFL
jgi:pyruvate kinase